MRERLWIAICWVALSMACSGSSGVKGSDRAAQPPGHGASHAGADTLYSCGQGGSFEGRSLEGSGDVEDEDSPLGDALRALFSDMDGVTAEEEWRVVWKERDEVLLMAPVPDGEHPYQSALFRKAGNRWKAEGWGDCAPTVIVGDRSPVIWRLEDPPSDESTQLAVVLEERACSGGRALTADNIEIEIDYLDDSIGILISADPLEGGTYTCPLRPSNFTIALEEPIGERSLVDKAVYPPVQRDG